MEVKHVFDFMKDSVSLNKYTCIPRHKKCYTQPPILLTHFENNNSMMNLKLSKDSIMYLNKTSGKKLFNVDFYMFKAITMFQILNIFYNNKMDVSNILRKAYNDTIINTILYVNDFINSDKNTYVICFKKDLEILWNDYINDKINYYWFSRIKKDSTDVVEEKNETLTHKFTKDYLKSLAWKYLDSHFPTINNWYDVSYLKQGAVQINGTACVGKTTLLYKLKSEMKRVYNKDVSIEKPTKFGTFYDKDSNMLSALQLQVVCNDYMNQQSHNCIFDRDKYNNIYWRYILALFNANTNKSKESIVNTFVDMFYETMLPSTLECMKWQPIIFLLNSNIEAVQFNMRTRCMKKDMYRSFLPMYPSIQNMVYGCIGELCNYWVVNTNTYDINDMNCFLFPIHNKMELELNAKRIFYNTLTCSEFFTKHNTIRPSDQYMKDDLYDGSKTLKIFK